jgi:hypothetical protein
LRGAQLETGELMQGKAIEKAYDKADEIISTSLASVAEQAEREKLLLLAGGWRVAKHVADSLNAAMIISIQEVRDTEAYRSFGYERIDDFLDNWEHSPMGYRKFNDNENLLKKLGSPVLFDLVRHSGIPLAKQRLIAKGDVSIEGGKMIVTNGDQSIELDVANTPRWTEALIALADAKAEEKAKRLTAEKNNDKLTQRVDQGRIELESKQRELDALRINDDPLATAAATAFSVLHSLVDGLNESDDGPRRKFAESYLPAFGQIWFRLSDACGVSPQNFTKETQDLRQRVAGMKPVEQMTEQEKKDTFLDRATLKMIEDGDFDDLSTEDEA